MSKKLKLRDTSDQRGKLRIGNDWNAITIIALSQSNPLVIGGCSALCLPVCGRTRTARPEACEIGPLLVLHPRLLSYERGLADYRSSRSESDRFSMAWRWHDRVRWRNKK